jgi:hypothetical protein
MRSLALLALLTLGSACGVVAIRTEDVSALRRATEQTLKFNARVDGRLTQLESEASADLRHKKKLSEDLGRIAEALAIFSTRLATMNCVPMILPPLGLPQSNR